ncbi:MAG: hypothetical protein ABW033_10505 [Acidimicrobiia bacterium]
MPQSRTRTTRAAQRAKYRKPKRRRSGSMGWNVAIAAVVILGIVAVLLTRGGGGSGDGGVAPFAANQATGVAGDHWHTYLGVNICGEWLTNEPTFEAPVGSPEGTQTAGIHSHGDGLIHTHPFLQSEAGNNATLGKYADYAGWSVSSDSIDAWTGPASKPDQTEWSNGDTCTFGEYKGKPGQLVWSVDGKMKTGNPSEYHQKDGESLAIGFLPKGVALEFPPDACDAFANISDQNTAAAVSKNSPCLAAAQSTTTTTAPPGQ